MSELKAETIVPQGCTITLQMYPKAEADKVIAELKNEIHNLKRSLIVARHEVANARGKTSNKYRVKLKKAFIEDEKFKEAK